MNDRFRFRVWDAEANRMIYLRNENDRIEFDRNGELIGINLIDSSGEWNGGLNCQAMQCTGLKDKTGRLIYEGDILKIVLHSTQHKPFAFQEKAVVEFKEGAFGHKDVVGHASLNHYAPDVTFEIIGNIHENPELLEGDL